MDSWERLSETRLPDIEGLGGLWMQNAGRLPRPVCDNGRGPFGRRFRKLPKHLPWAVRVGSGELFHVARPELGRASEKDESPAKAGNRCWHAPLYRKRDKWRDFDGEQEIRQGEQSVCKGYDPSKPQSHKMYLDANNLHGWAIRKPLPKRRTFRVFRVVTVYLEE